MYFIIPYDQQKIYLLLSFICQYNLIADFNFATTTGRQCITLHVRWTFQCPVFHCLYLKNGNHWLVFSLFFSFNNINMLTTFLLFIPYNNFCIVYTFTIVTSFSFPLLLRLIFDTTWLSEEKYFSPLPSLSYLILHTTLPDSTLLIDGSTCNRHAKTSWTLSK